MGLEGCEMRELTRVAYNLLENGRNTEAVEYFENAARKAKESGIASAIIKSYVNAGACLVTLGEYHRGRNFLQSALKVIENLPKEVESQSDLRIRRFSADIHYYLGHAYHNLSESETAIKHLTDSFNLYVCEELPRRAAESLTLMSRCYRSVQDYEREILTLKKLADIYHDMGDSPKEADACIILTRVYLREKKVTSVKQMLSNLKILCQRVEDSPACSKLYCELGVLYSSVRSFDLAMECFERGLAMIQRTPNKSKPLPSEASILQNIGAVYNERGMYLEAIAYHQEAIAIHSKLVNHSSESKCLCNLATAQLHLGQPEEAAISYSNALATANKIENIYIQLQACEGLGSIHIWWKKHGDAVGYFEQALVLLENITEDSGIARERIMEKLSRALELLAEDKNGERQELSTREYASDHSGKEAGTVDKKTRSKGPTKNTITKSLSPEFAAVAHTQEQDTLAAPKMARKSVSLRERRGVQGILTPIKTDFRQSPISLASKLSKGSGSHGDKGKGKLKRLPSVEESDDTLNEELQAYMESYAHSSNVDDASSDDEASPQEYIGPGSLAIGPRARDNFKVTYDNKKGNRKREKRRSKIVSISEPESSEESMHQATQEQPQQSRLCTIL